MLAIVSHPLQAFACLSSTVAPEITQRLAADLVVELKNTSSG